MDVLGLDGAVHAVRVEDVDFREVLVKQEAQWVSQVDGLGRPGTKPPFKLRGVLDVLDGESGIQPHDVSRPERPLGSESPKRDGRHSGVLNARLACHHPGRNCGALGWSAEVR